MKPKRLDPAPPRNERTATPFTGRLGRWRTRLGAIHLRDYWWRLLDRLEASRAWRVALYLTAGGILAGAALWFWAYPWWNRRNAIRIARAWLDSGHLRYAAEAAQHASAVAPESPEPWQIAAELARLGGQNDKALEYSRRAATLAPEDAAVVTGWAADAVRAGQPDEANRALASILPEAQAGSPHVQRLRGELARRRGDLTAAQQYFTAAQRLEGPLAINEVPLGLVLLDSTDGAVRKRGLELLAKWTADREWGATALRTLLADAMNQGDRPAIGKWAEALRTHPGCTVADMPACLMALARVDEPRYQEVLGNLERDHAVTPQAAAQLLDWLNKIGRPADAIRWMRTLPAEAMQRPPLAVIAAEAYRASGGWAELKTWTEDKNWGPDAEFLRWTYAMQAARMLGDEPAAQALWRTLLSHAQLNGAHALFAAASLYSWDCHDEAVALWSLAGEQEGKIAIDALGSLARHYQVQRDAEGQYRVFRRLHSLQTQDRAVANNFAFFAALTGREQNLAEKLARANLAAEPANLSYLATCAFTMVQQNRAGEALALLRPRAADAGGSPALAFAYGLALASSGRKAEARPMLEGLPPSSLTLREVELIKTVLID